MNRAETDVFREMLRDTYQFIKLLTYKFRFLAIFYRLLVIDLAVTLVAYTIAALLGVRRPAGHFINTLCFTNLLLYYVSC
ncbi:hypothetical protein [Spirosoma arcticum]